MSFAASNFFISEKKCGWTKMCVSAMLAYIHVKIHFDNRNKSYKTSEALGHHSSYGIITSTKVSDTKESIRILGLFSPLTLLGGRMQLGRISGPNLGKNLHFRGQTFWRKIKSMTSSQHEIYTYCRLGYYQNYRWWKFHLLRKTGHQKKYLIMNIHDVIYCQQCQV